MIKKTILALTMISGLYFTAVGQKYNYGSDSTECIKNISLYQTSMKNKAFIDAFESWKKATSICPKFGKTLWNNGAYIQLKLSKTETDAVKKAAYIDGAFDAHEKGIEHFGRIPKNLVKYGYELIRYKKTDPEAVSKGVALMKEGIPGVGNKLKSSQISVFYRALYKEVQKDPSLKPELLNYYIQLSEVCDANKAGKHADRYAKAQVNLDKIFLVVASCEEAYEIVKSSWDKLGDNKEEKLKQGQKYIDVLNKNNCDNGAVYEEIAEFLFTATDTPGHKEAYNLAKLKLAKKNFSEAKSYIKKASDLCASCEDQPTYDFVSAKLAIGNKAYKSAISYARKAMKNKAYTAGAYEVIGQAIAASSRDCAKTAFDTKAIYWLAADYMIKSKNAGSKSAGKYLAIYKGQFPTGEDMFGNGIKVGATYTVGCWINETTKARK